METTRIDVRSTQDEATAAAEAMSMCVALSKNGKKKSAMTFFADAQCHPQTIAVVKTRCEALGIEVVVGDATSDDLGDACIGADSVSVSEVFRTSTLGRWRQRDAMPPRRRRCGRERVYASRAGAVSFDAGRGPRGRLIASL